MSPDDVVLASRYRNVDSTYKTNRFGMPLTLFVTLDEHGKTQIVGSALICNEKTSTYQWICDRYRDAINACPRVVFTDADPAVSAAISNSWSGVSHFYCIWHIVLNLTKNLSSALGDRFKSFPECRVP